jgi:isoquinoline 1-oxidoreductase beta subunit
MPVAWTHRIVGSSVMARFAPPALREDGLDPDAVECAATPPYDFPNLFVDYVRQEPPGIPTAFWRGVGPTHNVFVLESFVDELANAAGKDPVAYRLALLQKNKRATAVVKLAAEKAGWGRTLPKGRGMGFALTYVFDTYLAQATEVSVSPEGLVRAHRIVAAVDCGQIVNPDTVKAQTEGGILFGLSAALYNEITLKDGRVEQSNFNDYRMLRIDETPEMEVHLIQSTEPPGGMGETGTVTAAPALTNAIFAATGTRIRRLPVVRRPLRSV